MVAMAIFDGLCAAAAAELQGIPVEAVTVWDACGPSYWPVFGTVVATISV